MAGPPPFALLPPALADPRGFLLRPVARLFRPRISSTTRRSATLYPLPASGSPLRVGFLAPPLRLRRQSRRASLGKAHRLPTSRPTSHRGASPDIGSRSLESARPAPRCHIARSLFATYAGSTSCFLPTRHLGRAVALLVSPFRPVTVGSLTSGTTCQKFSGVRHAKRTLSAPSSAQHTMCRAGRRSGAARP